MLQTFHLARVLVAGLATLGMPFVVEITLGLIDTPVNTEGLAMVAVVFYLGDVATCDQVALGGRDGASVH